ncbi:amidohydrolase family protein [Micromonospora violae]|uniref:amidohydrolase family protein n=1 Tax=Micromonospora violae TaxID=1278207 RepID=UPI001ABFD0FE|nr:amidohydrolase family protein [Micromonospora violae]
MAPRPAGAGGRAQHDGEALRPGDRGEGGSWTAADLRPAVEHALDVFGPDRLMFGSDWPVCLLATSYTRWVAALGELLAPLSDGERSAIWRQTAAGAYGLSLS